MTTENLVVTLGVTYTIEVNTDRFTELMASDYILSGEIRESTSTVISTSMQYALIATFGIVKSTSSNVITITLSSDATKNLIINQQKVYVYDIIAKNNGKVYKLIDGFVEFKHRVTSL